MSRKIIQAAKCSQMSNPTAGTGQGNDMCTEAVGSMINCTYKLGPKAKAGVSPEQIMHDLTAWIPNNGGNPDVSHLENFGIWFPNWLQTFGYTQISLNNVHNPVYKTIIEVIDQGHIAVGGFDDYRQLRLADGSNPYQWNPTTEPGPAGHVLLIVGYDTDVSPNTVIVHDPLRADPSGQPADYSWASIQAAGFSDCTQVMGAALPYLVDTSQPPPAPPIDKVAIGAALDAMAAQIAVVRKALG